MGWVDGSAADPTAMHLPRFVSHLSLANGDTGLQDECRFSAGVCRSTHAP